MLTPPPHTLPSSQMAIKLKEEAEGARDAAKKASGGQGGGATGDGIGTSGDPADVKGSEGNNAKGSEGALHDTEERLIGYVGKDVCVVPAAFALLGTAHHSGSSFALNRPGCVWAARARGSTVLARTPSRHFTSSSSRNQAPRAAGVHHARASERAQQCLAVTRNARTHARAHACVHAHDSSCAVVHFLTPIVDSYFYYCKQASIPVMVFAVILIACVALLPTAATLVLGAWTDEVRWQFVGPAG
jgi:hypothetical protein